MPPVSHCLSVGNRLNCTNRRESLARFREAFMGEIRCDSKVLVTAKNVRDGVQCSARRFRLKSRGQVAGPRGAAATLGIPASTLESKIKQLRIEKRRFTTVP